MNAQSVWGGHEYAYVHYVRKRHFPMDAIKVKVVSTRKVQQFGKDRADAYATVEFEHGGTREVNVRNLYDFWDSYMDEKNGRIAEQKKKEEIERAEALERAQQRRDAEARTKKIGEQLAYKLGLDPSVVTVNHYADSISIRIRDLQFLLED